MADPTSIMGVWLYGKTPAGRTVHVDRDPYTNPGNVVVTIDGKPAVVTRCTRQRDGGTTRIETLEGTIVRATPLRPARRHRLDGEPLGPL